MSLQLTMGTVPANEVPPRGFGPRSPLWPIAKLVLSGSSGGKWVYVRTRGRDEGRRLLGRVAFLLRDHGYGCRCRLADDAVYFRRDPSLDGKVSPSRRRKAAQ